MGPNSFDDMLDDMFDDHYGDCNYGSEDLEEWYDVPGMDPLCDEEGDRERE